MGKIFCNRIKVHGRVQGVGFRYSALNTAKRLNLKGYVKNLSSGAVLIEVEGEADRIDEMITWCQIGPGTSRVDEVEVDEIELKNYTTFEVRY